MKMVYLKSQWITYSSFFHTHYITPPISSLPSNKMCCITDSYHDLGSLSDLSHLWYFDMVQVPPHHIACKILIPTCSIKTVKHFKIFIRLETVTVKKKYKKIVQ